MGSGTMRLTFGHVVDTVQKSKGEEALKGDGNSPVDGTGNEGESKIDPGTRRTSIHAQQVDERRRYSPVGNGGTSCDHRRLDTDE